MKKRIDVLLTEKGFAESRAKAQAFLLLGQVYVDAKKVDKAGTLIEDNASLELRERFPYVSRGALKIQKAYEEFGLDFNEKVICDIGASTGGFTDFVLQHGAKKVYAIDVGYGQLEQKLRENSRVHVMERTNFREIDSWDDFSKRVILARPGSKKYKNESNFGQTRMTVERINFFVCDVSFISLKKIIPQIKKIVDYPIECVLLIKPQFEVGKEIADKTKGVIKNEEIQRSVVEDIAEFSEEQRFHVEGITDSPITGAKGNKEFLIYLSYN